MKNDFDLIPGRWDSAPSAARVASAPRRRGRTAREAEAAGVQGTPMDLYAGNVATCDPALFVSVVIWNGKEAWFRVNNPTDKDIETEIATPKAIKSFKPLKQKITVKAGSSLDVKA